MFTPSKNLCKYRRSTISQFWRITKNGWMYEDAVFDKWLLSKIDSDTTHSVSLFQQIDFQKPIELFHGWSVVCLQMQYRLVSNPCLLEWKPTFKSFLKSLESKIYVSAFIYIQSLGRHFMVMFLFLQCWATFTILYKLLFGPGYILNTIISV